jgi:hypothetical protein
MAIVTGPLMSLDASGTIGDAITFAKWKGRHYVRTRVIPENPKSAKQTGCRAMMSFLAQIWYGLTTGNKATWDDMAETKQISSFNAMVGENLSRWQDTHSPTKEFPAAEASAGLTITTQTLTGGLGHATIEITPSGATAIWGLAIFRALAEITVPSWANCIAVLEADGANKVTHVDSPLDPGTYHYRTVAFNTDGVLGTVKTDGTAVVT